MNARTAAVYAHGAGYLLLALLILTMSSCVTGPLSIDPVYATRSMREGNAALSSVQLRYPEPRYGNPRSLGAVALGEPVESFCADALMQELTTFGLTIDEQAALGLEATVLQAETLWRAQGRSGVFSTTFTVRLTLRDEHDVVRYRRIHQGSAARSQEYGGYPASASVAEALAQTYERFVRDTQFRRALARVGGGEGAGEAGDRGQKDGADFSRTTYRDHRAAAAALAPVLASILEGNGEREEEAVYAILGFRNREGNYSLLSEAMKNELNGLLIEEGLHMATRDTEEVLEEQKRRLSGLFDEARGVEIGRLAGADRIITGSLYHLRNEETVSMYLEVLEVETGLIVASMSLQLLASGSSLELLRSVDEGDGEEQD